MRGDCQRLARLYSRLANPRRTTKLAEAVRLSIQARWIYILGMLFVGAITKYAGAANVNFPTLLMLSLAAVAIVYNLLPIFVLETDKKKEKDRLLRFLVFFQFVLDIVVVTSVIHFAGGIESISFIFYFFIIISASLVYARFGVLLISILIVVSYNLLVYGEYFEVVPHYPRYDFFNSCLFSKLEVVEINTFAISTVVIVAGFLIGYLSQAKNEKEQEVLRERDRRIADERRLDKIKSRFIDIFSHQIRTPLTHIKLAVSQLFEEKEKLDNNQLKWLKKCKEASQRLINLTGRLVEMVNLENKDFSLDVQDVCLNKLIKDCVNDLNSLASQKNLKMESNASEVSEIWIKGDRAMIFSVIGSLVENAIDYSYEGNKVRINLSSEGGWARIAVINQGIGISEADKKNLFEKFYRSNRALHMKTDGSGLSLYLAEMIIRKHNGKVWFESIPHRETTFFIELPLSFQSSKGNS